MLFDVFSGGVAPAPTPSASWVIRSRIRVPWAIHRVETADSFLELLPFGLVVPSHCFDQSGGISVLFIT